MRTYPSVDSMRRDVQPEYFTRTKYSHPSAFIHPGLLHDTADFARMRRLIDKKNERAYASYKKLLSDSRASSSYSIKGPYTLLTRDASLTVDSVSGGTVHSNVESDVMAAYYNALLWQITGDTAHMTKAMEIVDAYSETTTGITGSDAALNGLYGFMLANAAEILCMDGSVWTSSEITACRTMLKNVFYPVLKNFVPCSHGNWDIIAMKCLMSIAVLCDDHGMYDSVLNYFYYGEGNGSIGNYIVSSAGQLQESNRDQAHSMLALGGLAELAEMASKQGDDLYSVNNDAIRRGYEYVSRYNMGDTVPYIIHYDYCERNYSDYTPESVSSKSRGNFRAVFEIAWNHYAMLKKTPMPWTLKVLDSTGAEGAPPGADHPGYGSLLFGRDSSDTATVAVLRMNTASKALFLKHSIVNQSLLISGIFPGTVIQVLDARGRMIAEEKTVTGICRISMRGKHGVYIVKTGSMKPFMIMTQ